MYKYNAATHVYAYLPCEPLILLFGERRQFKCTFPQPYDISTSPSNDNIQEILVYR